MSSDPKFPVAVDALVEQIDRICREKDHLPAHDFKNYLRSELAHLYEPKHDVRLQRLADEAAAWRQRYGMNTGSIIDRIADLGDADRWTQETQEAMKDD